MPKYAYYPGCAVHASARDYAVSAQLVCQALGIELQEIKDWTCCGASSAHPTSHLLGLSLAARNLRLAEEMGLTLTSPCPACTSRLAGARHELRDPAALAEVNDILGKDFGNTVGVEHLLQVLSKGDRALPVKRPLGGLKVAPYYGCLIVRPQKVLGFDHEENPQSLDRLLSAVGAEVVPWGFKTECCGAGMPMARKDMVHKLSGRILAAARSAGAEAVAVACPLCHSNLDMHQGDMKPNPKMPVLYFTQLMGLALGFSAKELLLDTHFTDALALLRGKGLA
ncbi:MAG: CoB--CoM heterodisulfide reductase iron-sulfur subunit B family protein [Chloroflexi bacterium]|nr:CoB--CoM heterodisulfide reductase iron-sulfur subunit B family protein [Chloroflexota bacterium]